MRAGNTVSAAGIGFDFCQFEDGENIIPVLPAMACDVDEIAADRFGNFHSGRLEMAGTYP